MNKLKKTSIVLAATISLLLAFIACNKEPKTKELVIDLSNDIPSGLGISTIIVEVYGNDCYEIARAEAKDNFKLTIPTVLSESYLTGTDNFFEDGNVSDQNTKCCGFDDISAFDETGELVGYLSFCSIKSQVKWYVSYAFVDRECAITGVSDGTIYDVSFKKGWNEFYYNAQNTVMYITTTKPSNVDFEWKFREAWHPSETISQKNREITPFCRKERALYE
jgi:hypothetical protein